MGKLMVVENDAVEGTDKHNVSGDAINPSPPPDSIPGNWIAEFDYKGKMTNSLSDFVKINGQPVALKTSKSSLNSGEDIAPTGLHSGPQGKNFLPVPPTTTLPFEAKKNLLAIQDSIGEGTPSTNSGSKFVTVDGIAILLDGDKIDTCDGIGNLMNSTVTAENQDFVFCSE